MRYRKQTQHWRMYRSGRATLVNRGIHYKKKKFKKRKLGARGRPKEQRTYAPKVVITKTGYRVERALMTPREIRKQQELMQKVKEMPTERVRFTFPKRRTEMEKIAAEKEKVIAEVGAWEKLFPSKAPKGEEDMEPMEEMESPEEGIEPMEEMEPAEAVARAEEKPAIPMFTSGEDASEKSEGFTPEELDYLTKQKRR